MAILKHTSSKNAAYGDALEYLKYKHREDSKTGLYEPILDEYGLLQERENYAICALDGHGQEIDPESWAGACMETNIRFGKNNTKGFISPFEMGRDFTAKEGDTITTLVVGVNPETFTVNLSVKKYDQVQNRKVVAQYLKQAPRPTLGQLLQDSFKTQEEDTKDAE